MSAMYQIIRNVLNRCRLHWFCSLWGTSNIYIKSDFYITKDLLTKNQSFLLVYTVMDDKNWTKNWKIQGWWRKKNRFFRRIFETEQKLQQYHEYSILKVAWRKQLISTNSISLLSNYLINGLFASFLHIYFSITTLQCE